MSNAVFAIVNDHIAKSLKNGVVPWRRPWNKVNTEGPINITGYSYNGINFFLLSMLSFSSNIFMTFNQMQKVGGKIKAGEEKNSYPVFFWAFLPGKDENGNKDPSKKIPVFRYTRVWNLDQVEGVKLPKRFTKEPASRPDPITAAETIVAGYKDGPEIIVKETNRACYYPAFDRVHVPDMSQYPKREEYYSTLFHELGHSTGHKKRLARKELMDANYFGSHDYSVEELTAEMTAAYLCAHSGIGNETLDNSAAYISGWLDRLSRDPKMVAMAAARAQKAFHHIVPRGEDDVNDEGEE